MILITVVRVKIHLLFSTQSIATTAFRLIDYVNLNEVVFNTVLSKKEGILFIITCNLGRRCAGVTTSYYVSTDMSIYRHS